MLAHFISSVQNYLLRNLVFSVKICRSGLKQRSLKQQIPFTTRASLYMSKIWVVDMHDNPYESIVHQVTGRDFFEKNEQKWILCPRGPHYPVWINFFLQNCFRGFLSHLTALSNRNSNTSLIAKVAWPSYFLSIKLDKRITKLEIRHWISLRSDCNKRYI